MSVVKHFVWIDKSILLLQHLGVWKLTDSCIRYSFVFFFIICIRETYFHDIPQDSILSIRLVGLVRGSYHSESYYTNDCIILYPPTWTGALRIQCQLQMCQDFYFKKEKFTSRSRCFRRHTWPVADITESYVFPFLFRGAGIVLNTVSVSRSFEG